MVYCSNCAQNVRTVRDERGAISCGECGKVLRYDNYSEEVTFTKSSDGQSRMSGNILRTIESENASRERLYNRAYDDMRYIKNGLGMGENNAIVDQAIVYYKIAVERNFTKGRRTEQVQAACLYIACRENRKPYLLIDFSNYLQINVYVLGAVFLQLCKVLNLTEHPICQKLLDPSIFIHKYTASLAGGKNKEISDAALSIIASMNRDWLQTGRRPSGLWGAALYISALSHGLNCSKSDILKLVHVCEATLSKRLVEFEITESGSLTIEELNAKAEEFKDQEVIAKARKLKERSLNQSNFESEDPSSQELLCQHKGTSRVPHSYGLCYECYSFFIGFQSGSDPPAFLRAEKQRKETSSTMHNNDDSHLHEGDLNSQQASKGEALNLAGREKGEAAQNIPTDAADYDKLHEEDDTSSDESGNFSDIDDAEVDGYLHNEEEVQYKKIIWEEMNREYLEEQAAKNALKASLEGGSYSCPEDAKKLDAALKESLNSKKGRQQKQAAEAKNLGPPRSATEAVSQLLTKKIRSRINHDALEKLFSDSDAKDPKKPRAESHPENDNVNDDLGPKIGHEKDEDAAEAYDYNNEPYDEYENQAYGNNYDDYDDDNYGF